MLELKSISKSFRADFWKKKQKILNQISFKIPNGEIVGFVGKNGCGKTTSIKTILGIIKPDCGQVIFSKELGSTRKEIFNKIGYLPENPRFFENLTGKSFLTLMAKLHGLENKFILERIDYLSDKLGILDDVDKKIGKYSKGMKQKIGFIAAIFHHPKLIILDEPLSGLDPISRRIFKEMIIDLKNEGASILMTSHILEDLFEISDQIIYMQDGGIQKEIDGKNNNGFFVYDVYHRTSLDIKFGFERIHERTRKTTSFIVKDDQRNTFLNKNNILASDIHLVSKFRFETPDYK